MNFYQVLRSGTKIFGIGTLLFMILHLTCILRKPAFAYAKTKALISCAVTAQLISAFVFAVLKVQTLFFLKNEISSSRHLLCLYSLVCVGLGRKLQRLVFS